MQIGKYWMGALAIASAVFLAACYDDNGNNTSSGSNSTSTNNLAPNSIVDTSYILNFTSGPITGVETLRILTVGTAFIRNPVAGLGFQSSGTYSPPVRLSGGNSWKTTLTMTTTNGVSTNVNVVDVLILTFGSATAGTFTLDGEEGANSGSFTATPGVFAESSPSRRELGKHGTLIAASLIPFSQRINDFPKNGPSVTLFSERRPRPDLPRHST